MASVNPEAILAPVLPHLCLAAQSSSPSPPTSLLPHFSPILRQRIHLLSHGSPEPWIRLLCYEANEVAPLLRAIATNEAWAPHPVSGEVEALVTDWSSDKEVQARYRRVDEETLQAMIGLVEAGVAFQLVYCPDDTPPSGKQADTQNLHLPPNPWRIGQLRLWQPGANIEETWFQGSQPTLAEAEASFRAGKQQPPPATLKPPSHLTVTNANATSKADDDGEDEDDDSYWARYDNTPSRTPGPGQTPASRRSPAPPSRLHNQRNADGATSEDEYFARYGDVQPAMDQHDPDGQQDVDAWQAQEAANGQPLREHSDGGFSTSQFRQEWTFVPKIVEASSLDAEALTREGEGAAPAAQKNDQTPELVHPRPENPSPPTRSRRSSSSSLVDKLEGVAAAAASESAHAGEVPRSGPSLDFGVRQHISRTVRSLLQLSQSCGMSRPEFERLVRDEVELSSLEG